MTVRSSLPAALVGSVALAVVFLLARGPLHRATYGLPVSNDDAIPLLMARHVLQGELATTLWNQPYNGALDSYLLAPGLLLGPAHGVFRGYEVLCAALLVLLVFQLARGVEGRGAAWLAAALAAFGTPYMGLMTATGPPPNFLMPLVTGFPLAFALRRSRERRPFVGSASEPRVGAGVEESAEGAVSPALAALVGLVCGLAVWNSSLAIPAFVGMTAGLAASGARPRRDDRLALGAFAAGSVLGASPLLVARSIGAAGASVVTAASAVTAVRPAGEWPAGLEALGRAIVGLAGLQVPLVVDGPERAGLPLPLAGLLALGLIVLLVVGGRGRASLPLVGWAAALAGAFALSRRTGPDELRYLYGLNAPVLALLGVGLARVFAWRRGAGPVLALALLAPWAIGHRRVTDSWRDASHATQVWQVPSLRPVLDTLARADVPSAYASLQFAGRLTLESGERVLASQGWNERIPGDPLRFRDEVDLDPRAAWVLSPHLSRGMPRARGFRELLQELGGTWKEDQAGDFLVFRSFRPPYDEARPVPREQLSSPAGPLPAALLDRDPATLWTGKEGLRPGAAFEVRVADLNGAPRRLDSLVLALDLEAPPFAVPWIAELDGTVVAHGPARHSFQWVNGAPRAARQALLVVPLAGQAGSTVRLLFQATGPPLRVAEVFAYGPDEVERPRAGDQPARRGLEAARAGHWADAERSYLEAVKAEPERASHHAAFLRARWRAERRQRLDVESLSDGGPAVVSVP